MEKSSKNSAALGRRKKNNKRKRNPIITLIKTMAVVAFIAWCLFSFVSTQSEIAGKRTELEALKERTLILEQENEDYASLLSENNERDFMKRIAIDSLGYAYPNERRFIDTTRN